MEAVLLSENNLVVHCVVDSNDVIVGSRQVGGGMGPGNPHGEESEATYTISSERLREVSVGVKVVVRPELEIFW